MTWKSWLPEGWAVAMNLYSSNLRDPINPLLLDRRTSRLTWLYVSALTAVAALSITGQLLVQRALRQQLGDSTIVNIAGRQRMLSQKLTKAALAWNHATNPAERDKRAAEIRATLQLWQRSHQGLKQGDAELALVASRSPVIVEQFSKLQPIIEEMVTAAEQLLATNNPSVRQSHLTTLLDREPVFLAAMDAAVFQLDHEAQARVARLQRIEWLLLSLTLVVLVAEGSLVFRPAVQRIRQAGHDLQIAKEAAESANEQKTRFLATLSHELRNPLHAILGNAELALEFPLDESQRLQVETMQDSARSLLSLVNDLLDLACIQAGKLRVQPAACDLRLLGERAIAMVQPLATRKHLSLELAKTYGEFNALGDPLRVQQVLLNLLGNAVKFTEHGSIQLTISRRGEMLRASVRDTGPGIPPALQQTIFAAFTQIDASTRREFSGVGLGLAISAGLVELMNGRIGVDSQPGQGSCFWLELPIAQNLPATPHVNARGEQSSATIAQSAYTQQKTAAACVVLIADDDAVNHRLLAEFLRKLGHTAVIAVDGRQALEHFQQQPFDLVLLDWHMPQLDGLEVARQMRAWETAQNRPRTSIVAISAAADLADEKVLRAGVDNVLVKPVSFKQLRQALRSFAEPAPDTSESSRWSATLARLQGNSELFRDLAKIFLEQLPDDLRRLTQLATRASFSELARAAHLLKGQAANFDAHALIAAAEQLEEAAEEASAARVAESLPRVQKNAAELRTSLEQMLAQLPAETFAS